ncbi:MAG: DnaJ domain-containing protein [Bacteroidota bacterium]|nr:DnaJ domain-containing protein [Bacteroidota bacterium]
MNKYYKILGLPNQSDKKLVKRAYRRLAMKYHPDKNDDRKANEKFILINEAYAKIMDESAHQNTWNTYRNEKAKAKEEELKKRMQWAKKYAQYKKDQEERIAEITYNKIQHSALGWIYPLISWVCIGFAFLLFLDFMVMNTKDLDVDFDRSYVDMATEKDVLLFKDKESEEYIGEFAVHIDDVKRLEFSKKVKYKCQLTPIFNELVTLTFYHQDENIKIFNHYSVYRAAYIFLLFLLTPVITLISKGPNFLHVFCVYFVSGFASLTLLSFVISVIAS